MSSTETISVQVVVRLRPMNELENKNNAVPVITANAQDKTITVIKSNGYNKIRSSFTFDNVFSAFSSQEEIFDATLKPVVSDVLNGYESTICAYGQTGTGKTYTMEGDLSSTDHLGIIPRAAQSIFESLNRPVFLSYAVSCSYLEIYNEELGDLLADDDKTAKLEIMEGKGGTFCRGLTEKNVQTAEDVLTLMQRSQQRKKVGDTCMNKHSSRSHCIFTIRVQAKRGLKDGGTLEVNGKLHMVDLAGSECAKTAALDKNAGPESAARERERMNINRSLLTLGRVIKTLREQNESKRNQNSHIPYRDSKLTRFLQESLGGKCKTLIIATLSPSINAVDESLSTINYAQTAMGIVNKPMSTSFLSVAPLTPSKPCIDGTTVEHTFAADSWVEMGCRLQYMQAQVDEAQAALARKHLMQQELVDRVDRLEEEKMELEKQCFETQQTLNHTAAELASEKDAKEALALRLQATETNLNETTAVLHATQQTEIELTSEAMALLKTLRDSIADGDIMHKLLSEARDTDRQHRVATQSFRASLEAALEDIIASITDVKSRASEYTRSVTHDFEVNSKEEHRSLSQSVSLVETIEKSVLDLAAAIRSYALDENGMSPFVARLVENINESIESLRCSFTTAEGALTQLLTNTITTLELHSNHLKTMNSDFLSASSNFVTQVETSVDEVKNKYQSIVTTASETIKRLRSSNEAARSDLVALVSCWQSSSNERLCGIEEQSILQSSKLVNAHSSFEKGWQHHESIRQRLAAQRMFIKEKGLTHTDTIELQDALLFQQQQAYTEALQQQQQLQDEFVKSMMDGMQALLKNQMDKLAKDQSTSFQSFERRNINLVDNNAKLRSGSTMILEKVNEANDVISKCLDSAVRNDAEIRQVSEESRLCLDAIRDTSKAYRDDILSRAANVFSCVDKMASQDTILGSAVTNLQSESDVCISQHVGKLLTDTSSGILQLTKRTRDMHEYSEQNLVVSSQMSLNAMKSPRSGVAANISTHLSEITASSSAGAKFVTDLAETIVSNSDKISNDVQAKIATYCNLEAKQNHSEIDRRKDALISKSHDYCKTSTTILSSSVADVSAVQGKVNHFASDVICADDMVPSFDTRKNFVYCDKFSSTPAADSIIEALNPSRCCLIADTLTSHNVDDNLSKLVPSTCRNSDTSDSSSIKSDSSLRISSPLRERSLNRSTSDINSFSKGLPVIKGLNPRLGHGSSGKQEFPSSMRFAVPASPLGNIGKKRTYLTPNQHLSKRGKPSA